MTDRQIRIDNLDPTFLFTWKGTRTKDEQNFHCHDHLELAFIMSGEGKYHIEDEIICVKEGDLIILNPGVRHEAVVDTSVSVPTTEFFVGISGIRFPGFEENYLPVFQGGHVLHTSTALKQKIMKICGAMEEEKLSFKEGKYFMLKAYVIQLILLIVREECAPPKQIERCSFESVNKKHVVEQIIRYLDENYASKISLDQIGENMYLSPFYISKIFKSETGNTPIRHLIDIRLKKAYELLISSQDSIQNIASKVGYDDAYHFSKLFKKKYGMSPSQARKGNKQ